MQGTGRDPIIIAISTAIYRRLISVYPRGFREEYGYSMVQLFRDLSLAKYRRCGVTPLPEVWMRTFLDLLKSAAEQHVQREAPSGRPGWVRLSGLSLMTLPLVGMMAYLIQPPQIRRWFYDYYGTEEIPGRLDQIWVISEGAGVAPILLATLLVAFGLFGLLSAYGKEAGKLGRATLWLAILFALTGSVSLIPTLTVAAVSWTVWYLCAYGMMVSIGLFGVATIRHRPLPRWNALPLFFGFFPVLGLSADWQSMPDSAWSVLGIATAIAIILLGIVLQTSGAHHDTEGVATADAPATR